MCGRFAQYESRDNYFDALGLTPDDILFDPEPIGRYNVAPGTSVLLLHRLDGDFHLEPVHWGYGPEWWHKAPLINARSETAATGRMFKPLWRTGRAVVPANGWFEWKRDGEAKQPYFIHHKSAVPLFFAAMGHAPFDRDNPAQGFVIVTAASDRGLVDIHDRMPLALEPKAAIEWINPENTPEQSEEIVKEGAVKLDKFAWHPVTKKVGNIRNKGRDLIEEIDDAEV